MSDRPMQPGGQLYESDDAIAEDKRKRAVTGSLEALCGMDSVKQICVDFMGFTSDYITTDSVRAAEIRKVYAMPDAIASEQIHDSDIIDRFIGDIYEQFLPALEERVKQAREDLSGFIKNELDGRCLLNVQESHSYHEIHPPQTLRGELEECGISDEVANATITLTQKGREALRDDLVSVIPVLEESQRTGITDATVDAVKFIKGKLEDAGVN